MTEWRKVPEVPLLKQTEIHVWRISLEQDQAQERQLEDYLSSEEVTQADAFHFPHDRKRFVVRRGVLRNLLGAYLNLSETAIPFLRTQHGKPSINGQSGSAGIHFNCSHSKDWGLIAINRGRELGVDLERHRPLLELKDLAASYFSHDEIINLMKQPEALKTRCFFDIWTRKEAFVKAIGLGLSFPLEDVAASLVSDPAGSAWKSMALDVKLNYSAELVHQVQEINEGVSVVQLDWHPKLIMLNP